MPSVWLESRRARGGRTWIVRWESVSKGVRSRGAKACGPNKAIAERFKSRKTDELNADHLGVDRPVVDVGWDEFAEAYLEHCRKHKAPRTVNNFDKRAMTLAVAWFRGRPPAGLTPQDMAGFESDLLKRFNPTTAHMWLRSLRTALRWGQANGFVRAVPAFHLPMVEKAGRVLTDQEVSAIYEALPANARGPFVFALHTGVRRGELLALRWERVRKATEGYWEAEIGGIGGPKTKTGRSRVVPLHPAAVDALGKPGAGPCFDADEHLSVTVSQAAKAAGLGRVRFHDLRHTWATRYMQATGDLFGLMQLGGWSSLGSVKVYQHLTFARKMSAFSVNYPTISPLHKEASSTESKA